MLETVAADVDRGTPGKPPNTGVGAREPCRRIPAPIKGKHVFLSISPVAKKQRKKVP
jgi:hypothetical protein